MASKIAALIPSFSKDDENIGREMANEISALIPSRSKDDEKLGKIYTPETFTKYHTRFAAMLPGYIAAYIFPGRALAPALIESVMVTMNSKNTCPYCTGLHVELARMAGADNIDKNSPPIVYATKFAEAAGRGKKERAAFVVLEEAIGSGKAASVHCLCWALLWGKTTGNSINNALTKVMGGDIRAISGLDVFLLLWYGPLFLVIFLLNLILARMPHVSPLISTTIGVVLWLPQALFILPVGISCIVLHRGVV